MIWRYGLKEPVIPDSWSRYISIIANKRKGGECSVSVSGVGWVSWKDLSATKGFKQWSRSPCSFFHSFILVYYVTTLLRFQSSFPFFALEDIRGSHPVLRFMHGHEHLRVLHTLAFAGFDDFAVLSSQRQGNRLPFWRFWHQPVEAAAVRGSPK